MILHTITRQDTGKGGKVSRITAKMREKEKRKDETELTQTLISILVKGAQIERPVQYVALSHGENPSSGLFFLYESNMAKESLRRHI